MRSKAERERAVRERMARIARRRAELAAKFRKRKPEDRRARGGCLLLALLLLLLVLSWCCCCGAAPVDPPVEVELPAAEPAASGVGEAPVPPPPELPGGRVPKKPRPDYDTPKTGELPWVARFRMQVAARGPRLGACFVGVDSPGTLRWSAEVEPASGRVSDHTVEATLGSAQLTPDQRACVIGVLSDPPYALGADERATPSRVGMAIEF